MRAYFQETLSSTAAEASREVARPLTRRVRLRRPASELALLLPAADPVLERIVAMNDLADFERHVAALRCFPTVQHRELGTVGGATLHGLRLGSTSPRPRFRVVVTAGVHGIEPAGTAAAMAVAAHFAASPLRRNDVELTLVPLVNPWGYVQRTRGNAERIDLNRAFTSSRLAPREVALTRTLLRDGPYDLGIDLHASRSAGERGFFALHNNASDLLPLAMRRFATRYPVLTEGTDRYVLEAPGVLRSQNRGTIKDYLGDRGTRWSMTIEAPAVWAYERQVLGTIDLLHTLIGTALELHQG